MAVTTGRAESELSLELIDRARRLTSLLEEKAPETERLRKLHPEVVDALRENELLSLGPPVALGGHDVDLDTIFEIGYELGRGCASTAWCWQIWTLHAWFLALVSSEAQAEVLAEGPDVILSSGYNPAGATAKLADGGCLLSGKWGFSSGVDYANWILLGANLPGVSVPDGAPTPFMLVPKSEVQVHDDWHVMGLKGTGSKSLSIDEPVFVPERRVVLLHDVEKGPAKALYGRASYGLPSSVSIGFVVASPFIGAARAIVDGFSEDMRSRRDSISGTSRSSQVALQMRIGEAAAEADAALCLARAGQRVILEIGAGDETITAEQRATLRLHQVYCVELARRAASRLFETSGTSALFTSSPVFRRFADINAGAKHFAHRWDEYTESYGRVRLGLEASALLH